MARRDGGAADLRPSGDLAAARDLAEGAPADLSSTAEDLARADVGREPVDAAVVVDLAMEPPADLRQEPADLRAAPPDLTRPDLVAPKPDLAKPPDLASPPDLAGQCVPQTQPCDVMCQNCGMGQKCGASAGKPVCQPAGNIQPGQACGKGGTDDCAGGSACIFQSQNIPLNLCRSFCRADADCKNGGKCAFTLVGGTLKVCSDPLFNCNPLSNSGCPQGGCYIVTPSGDTGCHQAGTGTQDSLCDTDYDCRGGYACDGTFCLKICNPQAANCPLLYKCYRPNGWPANRGVCDI